MAKRKGKKRATKRKTTGKRKAIKRTRQRNKVGKVSRRRVGSKKSKSRAKKSKSKSSNSAKSRKQVKRKSGKSPVRKAIKSLRLERRETSRLAHQGWVNNFSFVREFRPVRRITENTFDGIFQFIIKDLDKGRKSFQTLQLFWEITKVTKDSEGETLDKEITMVSAASPDITLIRSTFREKLFTTQREASNLVDGILYLRKSTLVIQTVTKTPRTRTRFENGEKTVLPKKKNPKKKSRKVRGR